MEYRQRRHRRVKKNEDEEEKNLISVPDRPSSTTTCLCLPLLQDAALECMPSPENLHLRTVWRGHLGVLGHT